MIEPPLPSSIGFWLFRSTCSSACTSISSPSGRLGSGRRTISSIGDRERVRHLLAHLLQRGLADQLGDLPLGVLVGGLLLRVERRALRQQADQQVLQQLDLVAGDGADRHHLGGVDQLAGGHQLLGDLLLRRGVGLGDHQDDRRLHLAQLPGDERVTGADGLVGRDAEHDDVDVGQGVADDVVEPLAQQALRLVQPRGVDEHDLAGRLVHHPADGVPGGLRAVADDADLLADQRVGQRRLAGVGAAHQGDEAAAVRRLLGAAHAASLPPRSDAPRAPRRASCTRELDFGSDDTESAQTVVRRARRGRPGAPGRTASGRGRRPARRPPPRRRPRRSPRPPGPRPRWTPRRRPRPAAPTASATAATTVAAR